MVRDASRRKQKYEGKIDADVMRSRILALKDGMVEQMEAKTADLATLETEVKRVIEAQQTVFTHLIPAYLNVGRQLYKLQKNFGGNTFKAEADIVLDKWKAKGLTVAILTEIAKLFGVTYP